MPMITLSLDVKSKWWLPVYHKALTLFCIMARRDPDYEKVSAFIAKHGISQKLKAYPVKGAK